MLKIGIMGAMIEEVMHIKEATDVTDEITLGGRTYYSGMLHGYPITFVLSRIGKVAASVTATTLINHFGVDLILFTGVAGAVDSSINIGDVVIGRALYQHDMDARPIFPRFQIPLLDQMLFQAKAEHLEKAEYAVTQFLQNIHQEINSNTLSTFSISKPTAHIGIIASGDQFISNPNHHDGLKLEQEKILAVEMEGAAVAQVCYEHNVDHLIIRTISDKADHSAEINFQAFIAEIASHYSTGIIKAFLHNTSNRTC